MPEVHFSQLLSDAAREGYAVGYFESWNLESLLATADAARSTRSPVILGFSGIYLPHRERQVYDPLAAYAALGRAVCRNLPVPACLLFNESPDLKWVNDAMDQGFGAVMYSDDRLNPDELSDTVRDLCRRAHTVDVGVEAEMAAVPGMGGDISRAPTEDATLHLTDSDDASRFVQHTGVDALAVNIGQVHLHGRQMVRLNLDRLAQLSKAIPVPLVLHGASSVEPEDLVAAIRIGIRKINVGSILKQTYIKALQSACQNLTDDANPYESIGSGLTNDVLTAGRVAMQNKTEELMRLFGSAGRAKR